jgi:hypothetical protein
MTSCTLHQLPSRDSVEYRSRPGSEVPLGKLPNGAISTTSNPVSTGAPVPDCRLTGYMALRKEVERTDTGNLFHNTRKNFASVGILRFCLGRPSPFISRRCRGIREKNQWSAMCSLLSSPGVAKSAAAEKAHWAPSVPQGRVGSNPAPGRHFYSWPDPRFEGGGEAPGPPLNGN